MAMVVSNVKILLLLLILLLSPDYTSAQELLERKITIKVVNQPLDETLQKIGSLGNFSFSYSPDIIDVKQKVSIQANNLSVREILNELFKNKATFKERRKYIILQKNDTIEEPEKAKDFDLNGYIIDKKTGRKLANASIYESVTLASAISNQYGYYKIRLPASTRPLRLEVRKEEYIGKSIPISGQQDTYLQITLNPDTIKPLSSRFSPRTEIRLDSLHHKIEIPVYQPVFTAAIENSTATSADTSLQQIASIEYEKLRRTYQKVQNKFVSAFASAQQAIHTKNIEDTLHQEFQASILPFMGTNHQLSGNIVNDYSLNLIAGYSLGVNKLEVGGLVNVVRGNVRGFQLAGVSNVVGKNVTGFQYANFLNLTLGNFNGFQGANVINFTGRDFSGFQVAGVGNVVAGRLEGYQFSTGYNFANHVKSGHQIGLINISDSSATIPFGLFSFVRQNGYRRVEFSFDDFNYFNATFKTGVNRFYNIFTLGFNGLAADKPLGTVGYGFGTAQKLGKGWTANADLTGSIVLLQDQDFDEIDTGLFVFSLAMEKKIGSRFAFFAGPTLNILASGNAGIMKTDETKSLPAIWLGPKPSEAQTVYHWLGFKAGIRFCSKI